MSRVIDVDKCENCPFYKNEGNVPFCYHKEVNHGSGTLIPYDNINEPPFRIAKGFPDFCPLEDAEDFAESNFNIDREDY